MRLRFVNDEGIIVKDAMIDDADAIIQTANTLSAVHGRVTVWAYLNLNAWRDEGKVKQVRAHDERNKFYGDAQVNHLKAQAMDRVGEVTRE